MVAPYCFILMTSETGEQSSVLRAHACLKQVLLQIHLIMVGQKELIKFST